MTRKSREKKNYETQQRNNRLSFIYSFTTPNYDKKQSDKWFQNLASLFTSQKINNKKRQRATCYGFFKGIEIYQIMKLQT